MSLQIPIGPISPFFIVKDAVLAANFYREKLGFSIEHLKPRDEPFFAIVRRDQIQIFLKAVSDEIVAHPNHSRHEWAPWDAFIFAEDPEALADDFLNRGAALNTEVILREDGLYGFEVSDLDGYMLFFGRPKR